MADSRLVLGTGRCLLIGEVALTHDGSLGLAHAYIDAVADVGADAVKFQTHIAAAESTPDEPFRVHFSQQDATRYDYWKRMEFTESQWRELAVHATDRNLIFLSSPFSLEAVDLLERVGMEAWKVPSGEVGNMALLDRMITTGKPVMLSSGLSSLAELDAAVSLVRTAELPVAVLQCTTAYPCPPDRVGLNMLSVFRERYNCPVGLSDHSGTIYAGLAASTLGADVLEVHVTMSRELFGPDVVASVTLEEFRQIINGVRFIEQMKANPVDKDHAAAEVQPLRAIFTKSLVARIDLPSGTILQADQLAAKKPGTGVSPERLGDIVGRRLVNNLSANQLLMPEDIEDFPTRE